MTVFELSPNQWNGALENHIRQRREMVGESFDGELARDVLSEQTECLGVVLFAHAVHLLFHVRLEFIKIGGQLGGKLRPVGGGVQVMFIEQLVEQNWVADQII